ncbi:MAG: DEAD/DEAH box helicase [Clostridiales bacterium]|nr:DEAD/DEAH box helicase [Clostridiales bacterium]HBM81780.1 ATP-dependent RNA helicase [Clostridiaceae bacterium]
MEHVKFEDLNLSKEILKAVKDLGFEEASPIQAASIPHMLNGKDIIGQSQTGTGKTAAFAIPILEMINAEDKKLQAIVLCPTRELAVQLSEEFRKLAKYKKNIKILPVYGGQPIERQITAIKKGVQIIIGTPGRILDHIRRRTIKLGTIKIAVLDEADEMLDMGFIDDIKAILNETPDEKQTTLFSATMPRDISELAKKYQKNPEYIKVVHKELTVPSIEQIYFEVKEKMKPDILSRIIDMYSPRLSLVFCNTKRRVDELISQLQARGYQAEGLHGDMRQSQRDRVMDKFRKGTIDILVATDVAARGIDVDNIDAVFNYDVPQDEEYYVHRIGRTARAGRAGRAFTFVVGKEIYKLRDIQKYTKTKIWLHDIPTVDDIEEIKADTFLDKIKSTINEGHLSKYLEFVERLTAEDYTSLDIAAALFKLSIGENTDNNTEIYDDFENTGGAPGMARLFINIGKSRNISPGDIVGAIANKTGISGKLIGTIDVHDKYTFVEVPKEYAREVLDIMKNAQIKGKKINIEPANSK